MEHMQTENLSEAEISMVLDTFMYLDYKEAREGTSLSQIVEDLANHPDYGGGGIHYGEYTILKEAVCLEEIGSLEISYQSCNMGYDSGTNACCFTTPGEDTVYIVYRGTGDGEWPDNGLGMTQDSTHQQEQALIYFEEVVSSMGIDEQQRLVVTGHSKGGNKAQFVTMETQYHELVDVCYSVDGQGFSEAAVTGWQQEYGQSGYQERTDKIYGIYGENDFVSVLGNSIISEDHIRYIETPVSKGNFVGYHDIKYMFSTLEYDPETREYVNVFHGTKNNDVQEAGVLGDYVETLSKELMQLEPEKRDGCAAVIMQLMEMTKGTNKGLNGEKLTLSDLGDFLLYGVPIIAESLVGGEEGKTFLKALMGKVSFGEEAVGTICLSVGPDVLLLLAEEQKETARKLFGKAEEIRYHSEKIPGYLQTGSLVRYQVKGVADRVEKLGRRMQKLADCKEEIALRYQKWESRAAGDVQSRIDFSSSIG